MNVCGNCQRPVDLKCYKFALRQKFTLLCAECEASLSALGMYLIPVERRETTLPVIEERRHAFRPAWLDRLTARDETRRSA